MLTYAAVLVVMIDGSRTQTVESIPFQTMEACEVAKARLEPKKPSYTTFVCLDTGSVAR